MTYFTTTGEPAEPKPQTPQERLRLVLHTIEQIEAQRLELLKLHEGDSKVARPWNQGTWGLKVDVPQINVPGLEECGTSFCFAGWTAKLDGCDMQWLDRDVRGVASLENVRAPGTQEWQAVWRYARDALGLTERQSDVLFDATNSLDDLRLLVNALIERPDITQDELNDLVNVYDDEFDDDEPEAATG